MADKNKYQNYTMAKDFHESIDGDFLAAELSILNDALSDPQMRIGRLRDIATKAERLAEVLSGVRFDRRTIDSTAEISSLLLFPMADAQKRSAEDIIRLPARLLDLSVRARRGIEWIKSEGEPDSSAPTIVGRPEGSGDRFRDVLFWEMKETWERCTGQQATFERDPGPPPSIVCPFCQFVEDYMIDLGQADTAEAILARFSREKARRVAKQ